MAKPRKVEEPATPYVATPKQSAHPAATAPKTPATSTIRHADDATFHKATDKVFKTRDDLFRKLAQ
jgi:hypothetical protein